MTKSIITAFIYLIFWNGVLSPFVSSYHFRKPSHESYYSTNPFKDAKQVSDSGVFDYQLDVERSVTELFKVSKVQDAFKVAFKNRMQVVQSAELYDQEVLELVEQFDPAVVNQFQQVFLVIRKAQLSVYDNIKSMQLKPLLEHPGLDASLEQKLRFAYSLSNLPSADVSQHLYRRSPFGTWHIASVICAVAALVFAIISQSSFRSITCLLLTSSLSAVAAGLSAGFGLSALGTESYEVVVIGFVVGMGWGLLNALVSLGIGLYNSRSNSRSYQIEMRSANNADIENTNGRGRHIVVHPDGEGPNLIVHQGENAGNEV